MRDIQAKVDASGDILSAEAFNTNFIDELQALATTAGFTLDVEAGPDTDTSMLTKSITNYSVGAQYFEESGAADAYVLTRSGNLQALSSYFDGIIVTFKPGNSNTGASTVNIDGVGLSDIVDSSGAALTGGEITAGQYVTIRYNSSTADFEIVSAGSGGSYALDSTVVHLAGAEDITGIKTISGGLDINNNVPIRFANFSGTYRTFLQLDASDQFQLGNATVPCYLRTDGNFYHNGNAVWDTGNDSNLAKLSATQAFTGTNTFNLTTIFNATSNQILIDSTANAEIQLDAGTSSNVSQIKAMVAGVNKGVIKYNHNATASSETLDINVGGITNTVASFDGAGTLTLPETAETKIALTGANNPLIAFYEGAVNKGYIRWMADGYMRIRNLEDTGEIRIKNDIEYSPNGSTIYTIYHTGNDSVLAHLAGAETFTGTKTFSVYQLFNNNVFLNAKESGGTNRAIIGMSSSDIVTLGNGTNNLDIYAGGTIAAKGSYLQLDNNYYVRGLTTGAATRGLIGITSGNIVDVGSGLQVTNLRSSGTLTFNTSGQVWTSVEFGFSESSFTPTIWGTTTTGTGTYTIQYGRYQRVGDWVHFRIYLTWTAHTGTGGMRIGGLPFTSEANNCAVALVPNDLVYAGDYPIALVLASSTNIGLYNATTGASLYNLAMDTSANIAITGSYQIA